MEENLNGGFFFFVDKLIGFYMFKKANVLFKLLLFIIVVSILGTVCCLDFLHVKESQAATLGLPEPSKLLKVSSLQDMPVLRGIRLDPQNPLNISFIVDLTQKNTISKEDSQILVQYFLAALTVDKKDLWVNLSPYEHDRVITQALGETELGKDLLGQDYILKQLSSSLTHPDTELGSKYWAENNNEFSKIWIMPDVAELYSYKTSAVIKEASLKLQTEVDYLGGLNSNEEAGALNSLLPAITKDVNQGKNFAKLRQIYYSLILAEWFKNTFKNSFYAHYINQNKINGIDLADKTQKDRIYKLYCQAFKKGVYNLIKKTKTKDSKLQKRRYFSGGFISSSLKTKDQKVNTPTQMAEAFNGPVEELNIELSSSAVRKAVEVDLSSYEALYYKRFADNYESPRKNYDFIRKNIIDEGQGKFKIDYKGEIIYGLWVAKGSVKSAYIKSEDLKRLESVFNLRPIEMSNSSLPKLESLDDFVRVTMTTLSNKYRSVGAIYGDFVKQLSEPKENFNRVWNSNDGLFNFQMIQPMRGTGKPELAIAADQFESFIDALGLKELPYDREKLKKIKNETEYKLLTSRDLNGIYKNGSQKYRYLSDNLSDIAVDGTVYFVDNENRVKLEYVRVGSSNNEVLAIKQKDLPLLINSLKLVERSADKIQSYLNKRDNPNKGDEVSYALRGEKTKNWEQLFEHDSEKVLRINYKNLRGQSFSLKKSKWNGYDYDCFWSGLNSFVGKSIEVGTRVINGEREFILFVEGKEVRRSKLIFNEEKKQYKFSLGVDEDMHKDRLAKKEVRKFMDKIASGDVLTNQSVEIPWDLTGLKSRAIALYFKVPGVKKLSRVGVEGLSKSYGNIVNIKVEPSIDNNRIFQVTISSRDAASKIEPSIRQLGNVSLLENKNGLPDQKETMSDNSESISSTKQITKQEAGYFIADQELIDTNLSYVAQSRVMHMKKGDISESVSALVMALYLKVLDPTLQARIKYLIEGENGGFVNLVAEKDGQLEMTYDFMLGNSPEQTREQLEQRKLMGLNMRDHSVICLNYNSEVKEIVESYGANYDTINSYLDDFHKSGFSFHDALFRIIKQLKKDSDFSFLDIKRCSLISRYAEHVLYGITEDGWKVDKFDYTLENLESYIELLSKSASEHEKLIIDQGHVDSITEEFDLLAYDDYAQLNNRDRDFIPAWNPAEQAYTSWMEELKQFPQKEEAVDKKKRPQAKENEERASNTKYLYRNELIAEIKDYLGDQAQAFDNAYKLHSSRVRKKNYTAEQLAVFIEGYNDLVRYLFAAVKDDDNRIFHDRVNKLFRKEIIDAVLVIGADADNAEIERIKNAFQNSFFNVSTGSTTDIDTVIQSLLEEINVKEVATRADSVDGIRGQIYDLRYSRLIDYLAGDITKQELLTVSSSVGLDFDIYLNDLMNKELFDYLYVDVLENILNANTKVKDHLNREVQLKNGETAFFAELLLEKALTGHCETFDDQVNFLKILQAYFEGNIPSAEWFGGINDDILKYFQLFSYRTHLWNDKAIAESAEMIRNLAGTLDENTVIVEMASGYGDWSLGLQDYFPLTSIITTDGFRKDEENLSNEGTGIYDNVLVERREVKRLTFDDLSNGQMRKKLKIAKDKRIILIASHLDQVLDSGNGSESIMLAQKEADIVLLVNAANTNGRKKTGDFLINSDLSVWESEQSVPSQNLWKTGLSSNKEKVKVYIETYKRKENISSKLSPEGGVNFESLDLQGDVSSAIKIPDNFDLKSFNGFSFNIVSRKEYKAAQDILINW